MFNTLNTIRPKPYPQKSTENYNGANSSTDKDGKNGQQQDPRQQRPQTIARGRASDIQENNVKQQDTYIPSSNTSYTNYNTRPAYNVQTPPPIMHSVPHQQINPMQYQAMPAGYQPIEQVKPMPQQPMVNVSRSNKINIAQILKDFRNTIKAIATPPEIEEQVERYLQIVGQQVRDAQPQVNLIQSNLKIAASLLDRYISETLNKESKVVQNWLDALFLQKIDYSYNENDVNPNFLVKFPENQENAQPSQEVKVEESIKNDVQQTIEPEIVSETDEIEPEELSLEEEFSQAKIQISKKPNITIVPQDTKLKSLFVEAKKQAFSNNPQKAMRIFKEAFNRAEALKDNETQSRICLEIGKIYDDNEHLAQALNSYNKSLQYTTDINVKSRAHFSMAQIYDDVNEVSAALEHYITSISYACKSDDLIGQSDSLTKMGNILTDKYDDSAFDYYEIARKLVDQTTDHSMKGYVLSNTADACVQFKKNDKALKYYAEAVRNFEKVNSKEDVAENYKAAAELMISFNNYKKAKSLLKKALVNAVKTTNEDLVSEVNMLLSSIED